MNTALRRFILIGRDAGSAAGALTNLHRCLAKLQDRCEKLPGTKDAVLAAAIAESLVELTSAKLAVGQALASLDIVTARVEVENRRIYRAAMARRREARDGR